MHKLYLHFYIHPEKNWHIAACCTRKLHIYVFICRQQTKSDLFDLFRLALCVIFPCKGIKYLRIGKKMVECQGSLLNVYY